jgi:hypothetical protein
MAITVHVSPSGYHVEIEHIPGIGHITVTPQDALNILVRLSERRSDIADLANNYYQCKACAGVHAKGKDCYSHLEDDMPHGARIDS